MILNNFDQEINRVIGHLTYKVNFAGFESNTRILQSAGWNLSVETINLIEYMRSEIHLIGKFDSMYFLAKSNNIFETRGEMMLNGPMGSYSPDVIAFNIVMMSSNINLQYMAPAKMQFNPIDAFPCERDINLGSMNISDVLFKKIPNDSETAEQIVIAPENMLDILDKIRKAQDPKQAEIRRKRLIERRRENKFNQIEDIKAQLMVVNG